MPSRPAPPHLHRAVRHRDSRIRFQDRDLILEGRRPEDVVRIQARDIASSGLVKAQIPGGDQSPVVPSGMAKDCNPPEPLPSEPRGDGGGSVGRAVVDDKQFPGAAGLAEDALDGLGKISLAIQNGNRDRHLGVAAHWSTLCECRQKLYAPDQGGASGIRVGPLLRAVVPCRPAKYAFTLSREFHMSTSMMDRAGSNW